MKKIIITCFLFSIAALIFAQQTSIPINEYLEVYLENSSTLESAADQYDDAAEAYQTAQRNKESSYTIELARIDYEYAEKNVQAVKNTQIIDAFTTLFQFNTAQRSLANTEESEVIALAEYNRAKERYSNNLISFKEYRQSYQSYLQAVNSTVNAKNSFKNAAKSVFRSYGYDWEKSAVSGYSLEIQFPALQEIKDGIDSDPDIIKIDQQLALYQQKLLNLRQSKTTPEQELADLQDQIDSLNEQRQNRVWDNEDFVDNYLATIAGYVRSLQLADVKIELKKLDLDTTQLQYEYGEIYESDLQSAALSFKQTEEDKVAELEQRFLEYLNSGASAYLSLSDLLGLD